MRRVIDVSFVRAEGGGRGVRGVGVWGQSRGFCLA